MAKRKYEPEEVREHEAFVVEHSIATEVVVLAAMLVDRETRRRVFARGVRPDSFITPQYVAYASALQELERRNLDYDPAMVKRVVGDRVDVDHLVKLNAMRPDVPDDLDVFIDGMLWDRQRVNAATSVVGPFLAALKNPAEPPERVRALAAHVAESFRGSTGAGRFLCDGEALVEAQTEQIRRRLRGEAIYPFGIEGLDDYERGAVVDGEDVAGTPRLVPGAKPGHVTVLTGYTGSGKTTIAFNMALGLARQGRVGLYCAWEPEAGETLESIACVSLGMSRTRFYQGNRAKRPLTEEEVEQHRLRMHEIAPYIRFMRNPFRLRTDERRASNERNLDVAQEHVAASGAEWVIFDLWERALVDTEPSSVTAALWRTQAMSEELGFHAIVLAQQLIKGDSIRTDKRPTLENIKYSSSFGEVAHLVLGVHREGIFKPGVGDTSIEVHQLKGRHMRRGIAIECDFDGDKGRIWNGRTIPPMGLSVEADSLAGDFLAPGQVPRKRGKGW